mmetsp:Transcript_9174/g.22117  ORF Transcript_9174/g.22117 Transcript_9174/m.22117 type:complete len:316 (-) Transcript_9174:160-1107(-)
MAAVFIDLGVIAACSTRGKLVPARKSTPVASSHHQSVWISYGKYSFSHVRQGGCRQAIKGRTAIRSGPENSNLVLEQAVESSVPSSAAPTSLFSSPGATAAIILLQAVGLVGAFVTGTLARRRRKEVEKINAQLRQINARLREQSFDEAIPSTEDMMRIEEYRESLKASVEGGSVHQSTELDQKEEHRRQLLSSLTEARELLEAKQFVRAEAVLQPALGLARQERIGPAARAVLRLLARAYAGMEMFREAVGCLEQSLAVSIEMEEFSGDADVFGEIADLHTQLGNLELAAEYYDRCIAAIGSGQPSQLSTTWDV